MHIKSNSRIFIAGKTGSGKTTLVKRVLYPMYTRRVFWDIKCENSDLLVNSSLCRSPAELAAAIKKGKTSILYQPADISPEDFNRVCEILFNTGNFALFVDEAATVTEPNWIEPWHNQIMIRGRSRGVGIVNVTQRPRACHNTLISEAEHFFIYRLQLETDVAKIKTILPKKYLSEIYTLPEFHCFYSDNTGIVKPLAPIRL
jgi:energy-coupling factor transporter ATP-binding protein EcfA2